MRTREQVEHLKKDWLGDPNWDIETTEGFENYHDELLKFRLDTEAKYKAEREEKEHKKHEKFAAKVCPMKFHMLQFADVSYQTCEVEKCAWWDNCNERCSVANLGALEKVSEACNVWMNKNKEY